MRYTIDYGCGIAELHTEAPDPERRFYQLAGTCFGIRKSITAFRILGESEQPCPQPGCERLAFGGDAYIWRADGARKMVSPWLEDEWDTQWCEECAPDW